jgi:putative restriction endonuclease
MRQRVPLISFCGIARGRYLAVWPVFVVGDDLGQRVFRVAADDARLYQPALGQPIVAETDTRRAYCTANVRQRLHQRQFRERVMDAYGRPCALCRLRHEELLDATHIVPDGHEKGDPVVPNGPALCTLHHAAFDGQILGVRPDYTVEVR